MDTGQNILIKDILAEVIKQGASDLHFSVGNHPILRVGRDLWYLDQRELVSQTFMEKLVDLLLTKVQKEKLIL